MTTAKYAEDFKRTSDKNYSLYSLVVRVCVCVHCLLTCMVAHVAYIVMYIVIVPHTWTATGGAI